MMNPCTVTIHISNYTCNSRQNLYHTYYQAQSNHTFILFLFHTWLWYLIPRIPSFFPSLNCIAPSCLPHPPQTWPLKPGIHSRQRKVEAQHGSLSSSSVDGAMNQATRLRGCCDPSPRLSVDQSEVSLRNSPPRARYVWNMPHLAETEKYSLMRGALKMPHRASACLCL